MSSAVSSTESAISDSTSRDGSETTDSVASDSVIECATVNAVTVPATLRSTRGKLATGSQRRPRRTSTDGKQQRDEEQEVIEPGRDVLDAVADETAQLRERGEIADRERLATPRFGEDRADDRRTAVVELQEPAMLRVDVEQQPVVDIERIDARRARTAQRQHEIAAVAVPVDLRGR